MDEVFKAISDPSRRLLLDSLGERDGQTLGELCEQLPQMTRFGVMNHLKVLEEAGVVTTLREGRSKYHYLNPVPIRLIHDRWITKYAEPRVATIAATKARLEAEHPQAGQSETELIVTKPDHVYKTFIHAPQERVWQALTDGDLTVQYFYGTRVESTWEPGSSMNYLYPDGRYASTGEVLSIDAPHKLECTFLVKWDEELEAEGPCREVWSLAAVGDMTQLTVEVFDAPEGSRRLTDFKEGFPYIFAAMKTLLETGEPLPMPVQEQAS